MIKRVIYPETLIYTMLLLCLGMVTFVNKLGFEGLVFRAGLKMAQNITGFRWLAKKCPSLLLVLVGGLKMSQFITGFGRWLKNVPEPYWFWWVA